MLNKGFVIGRLASDPELRFADSNLAIVRVNIFCQREYKNNQGKRDNDVFSLLFYRERAENFAKYARKGSLIFAEYTLKNNNYIANDGKKVYSNDMIVSKWNLLSNANQGKVINRETANPIQNIPLQEENLPIEPPSPDNLDESFPSFEFPPLPE
ncbi:MULTISPECIES: single-stranded DNA-binding protein [unclassified Lactococcus]|uniref:single-stranded DNA-binding protein n=1 Tax=unclassified Lactococcus TaxID=2643510 RepID=UPI002579B783|nr:MULTISPECIES: single-stranded DNA-binding protein [unclassified Lactococcus]